ncbi:MAG: Threonine dehydrogenase and related Zn-dependent dehydrogenases, partial [uncultured Thermomicrobiales bacterium]
CAPPFSKHRIVSGSRSGPSPIPGTGRFSSAWPPVASAHRSSISGRGGPIPATCRVRSGTRSAASWNGPAPALPHTISRPVIVSPPGSPVRDSASTWRSRPTIASLLERSRSTSLLASH